MSLLNEWLGLVVPTVRLREHICVGIFLQRKLSALLSCCHANRLQATSKRIFLAREAISMHTKIGYLSVNGGKQTIAARGGITEAASSDSHRINKFGHVHILPTELASQGLRQSG